METAGPVRALRFIFPVPPGLVAVREVGRRCAVALLPPALVGGGGGGPSPRSNERAIMLLLVGAQPRGASLCLTAHARSRPCLRVAVRQQRQVLAQPRGISTLGCAHAPHASACAWQSGSSGMSSPSREASPCSTVLTSCAPAAFRQCALGSSFLQALAQP
jgi:hypothetical protein